jgi:exodeoxyribonuclease VII large subunit
VTETLPPYAAKARPVLTPTQLNRLARSLLEDSLGLIWVEGEVSNLTRAASGHWYFTLKDAQAQIRCAMFRTNNQYVRKKPVDGSQVLVRGRVSLYEARGDYQLICEHMEEAGLGRLMREFEALKAKLHAEGLTDPARKRSLPRFPRRIAIITSPQGAAIRDVVSVLARRWPPLSVDIFPAQVQGAEAPAQLRQALGYALRALPAYDVILLTRGGGSLEDLLAFNDEALARAIAASPVPTVSAVGHEIDFSIADLVADLRAPTPSAAAELISPDVAQVQARLRSLSERAVHLLQRRLQTHGQSADACERLLRAHDPRRALVLARARLAQRLQDLIRLWTAALRRRQSGSAALHERLRAQSPQARIARLAHASFALQTRLATCSTRITAQPASRLARLEQRLLRLRPDTATRRARIESALTGLNMLGPQATLERGYVLLRTPDGRVVTRAAALELGQALIARFADGEWKITADDRISDPVASFPNPK